MTEEELARSGSPLMYGAYVALRRAALMARETARQTGTAIVIEQDGKLRWLFGEELNAVEPLVIEVSDARSDVPLR